ncbi:MAG: hypothetical protein PHQ80_03145 [Candidatus ainarchaeum sp.]|nr:hypothetical protein [Candidatus ainarchaeum sp.]MDD5096022.1 hypothetical protein [Candidatus ainarchaeum sp.]
MKASLLIEDEKKVRRLVLLGAMEEDGKMRLPYLEAAYFAEKGEVEGSPEGFLSLAEKSDPLAPEKYLVLKHLRNAGFIVRAGESADFLRVYKKGIRVGEDRTMYLIRVLRKSGVPDLHADLKLAGKMRKELVYAFVGDKIEFVKAMRVNFE